LSISEKPRGIDPGTVLSIIESMSSLRQAKDPASAQLRARDVARIAGAGEVMLGRISGTSQRLSFSATIFDVKSGEQRATTQVTGSVDSLSSLVETLATRLVAQSTVGADRANAFANARFSVLRSYLRAESAFHDDNYKEAVGLYEQTLAQDSTFTPAALGLAVAWDRRNSAEQHDRGLALAWAGRERLGDYDRVYLTALAGPRYPDPSPVSEQLAAWERVVKLNPDRAPAWVELGDRFLFDGGFLGIRNANDRAIAAFKRALELDPSDPRAVRGLVIAAVRKDSINLLNDVLRRRAISQFGGELSGYLRWRVALARHDTAELDVIRNRFSSFNEPSLRAMAMASQHENIAVADGERAARFLAGRAMLTSDQLDVLLAQHSFALNEGDYIKALDVTEQIQDVEPGSRAHLRLRVLDALYGGGDERAAEKAVNELEGYHSSVPSDAESRALRVADLCVLAQWYAAPWHSPTLTPRNREAVRSMIAELRSSSPPASTIPVAASPKGCAEIAYAMLGVARRTSDARARVQQIDNMMLAGPAMGDATVWATLATARLYEALGDNERALAVVQQRPFMKGWPRYLAASRREEAALMHKAR
jgi:tetratricopeptide (TPR) repeat protein